MKIKSIYNDKDIITYWNNKFITRDTVTKVNAMYIDQPIEISIIYFNIDEIKNDQAKNFVAHFKSVKISTMTKFIDDLHWGFQFLIVLIIFFTFVPLRFL